MKNNLLKADSAQKNFIFQIIYQAVVLVIPLVVSPYLTRTLGSTALGTYTYTYSIAYYFVVFGMLGINKHGQRIIAQRRHDYDELRTTFWSLYFIHFVASGLLLLLYYIYVILICRSNKNIAIIQSIYVLSGVLDITWLFYGLEKFKSISIRNLIIKIVETICIFVFVKIPSDVGKYTMIMCVSTCLGQLIMMPQVVSAIPPKKFKINDVKEHVRPLFVLFAAVIASTLYTMFDKTLLGLLSTTENVAFYEYSDKIVKIPRTFISVIGTVLFPKACRYAKEGKIDELNKTSKYCFTVTYLIGFAAVFGLFAVSDLFALVYYGEEFSVCGRVIKCMCPLILIIGLGEAVRQCYLYPMRKDGTMVKVLFINAAANIVVSCLLIPKIGIYGAVAGTITAEMIGLIIEMWLCRKFLSIWSIIKEAIPYAFIGTVMYFGVKIVAKAIDGTIIALIIQVVVGALIYGIFAVAYCYLFNDFTRKTIDGILNKHKS